jgi:predicted O-linked N-acetylglucosamine transferase (SPINDLY family)
MPPSPTLAEAVALVTAGNPGEASRIASQRLRDSPREHGWLHVLGYAQHASGDHEAAARSVAEAIGIAPSEATYRNTLGAIELARGHHASAQAALREALAIDPGYVQARFNLAQACIAAGDTEAGLAQLDDLLRRNSDFAPARLERARVLAAFGRATEAVAELRYLLERNPGHAGVQVELGTALFHAGDLPGARQAWASVAVHRAPDLQLLTARAAQEVRAGRAEAAIEMLGDVVRRAPDVRAPYLSLAAAYDAAGDRGQARAALQSAIERGHRDAAMLSTLAMFKARACEWTGLAALLDELRPKALIAGPTPPDPRHALYFDGIGALEQRRWAENWCASRFPTLEVAPPCARRERGGRYRIGFLSAELRDHPTARLAVGMLEAHDRDRFEYIAYSHGPGDVSSMRHRLEHAFDRFADVSSMPSREIARRIRGDEVDVLVDLEGHTRNSRLEVLALRPAPLQAHFVGYPGTLGAGFVDLFISDMVATPPGGGESGFTEKVLRMPGSCQPNDARRHAPSRWPREQCGLSPGAMVFCCFNQPMKVTPSVFDQWCRLLGAVEGSVLWLLEFDPEATGNLRKSAAAAGIDPGRLIFAPRVGPDEHLDRLGNADMAIDVFPCGSHTTASDALWGGVPLLTAMGETFASRVAGSVLAAAGLDDLVYASIADSIDAAIAIARDPARLAVLRGRAESCRTSRLFDSSAFARDFESLLAREIGGD